MNPCLITFKDLMKSFEAQKVVTSIRCLLGNASIVEDLGNCSVRKDVIKEVEKQWKTLFECCKEANLQTSTATLGRLSLLFDGSLREDLVSTILIDNVRKALITVEDELSSRLYFILEPSEAAMYKNPLFGWEDILDRFSNPELTFNVEEMARCYALCRYTASMFHAMHVAEWGAISLGDFIEVTDPKKGWGATGKRLKEIIDGGHAKLPSRLTGKFALLEQMNQAMSTMAVAWRHKVDHAVNRLMLVPSAEFAPELAEHIMGAVKVFMVRIMEGIPK